ncbi:hypothetical protein D0Z00_001830 [Geotrichum galactomycetum]|uniref:Uncharacterized protein n=1 Tax=Geotrichum galactomycetum TaxID=27317 RepID=A0ACB6V5V8_9ASCO|nr:hypothetical protein D0Z00_001830 [Geotrichum candidum]
MAITYRPYTRTVDGEKELHEIKDLVSKDLSEPYSLYVFIYFIYKNPDLCIMDQHADEIVLEVEAVNNVAIHLYETVGFMRSKRLHHHYLNSNDAFRLILPLSDRSTYLSKFLPMLDNGTLPAAAA